MIRTCIRVISLSSASDRRSTFAARAEGRDVPWSFFDALTAIAPPLIHDPAVVQAHHGRHLRPGELGVYASHVALWRELASNDEFDQYIILEDDVIADWNALRLFAETDIAAAGIEYLRLFYRYPSPSRAIRRNWPRHGMYVLKLYGKPYGAQGYVLTKQAARRFIAAAQTVKRPIDDEMDRFWENKIPNLCIFPFVLLEESVRSTIGSERFSEPRSTKLSVRRAFLYDRMRRKSETILDDLRLRFGRKLL